MCGECCPIGEASHLAAEWPRAPPNKSGGGVWWSGSEVDCVFSSSSTTTPIPPPDSHSFHLPLLLFLLPSQGLEMIPCEFSRVEVWQQFKTFGETRQVS
ncbi:hypothetical protein E2C01_088768 [Portunus trituberculatus]|uniref:Uncharacterized protein n=1 Tax=Portunus trituberculatus TaxID=210409 RepID=A0A5B7JGY8_PORTR|nr:hypothetical protein [Portunus trituberculatus]